MIKQVRADEPFFCTAETPWSPGVNKGLVLHPDATKVDEAFIERRCPHCGYEWERELPQ